MASYKRIACDFYDHFEIHALRKDWVSIETKEGNRLNTRIKSLETKDKEEFAHLLSDKRLRLDEVNSMALLKDVDPSTWRLFDLIDYDLWANRKVLGQLENKELSNELKRRFSHILNVQNIWLDRINNAKGLDDSWSMIPVVDWITMTESANMRLLTMLESSSLDKQIYYSDRSGNKHHTSLGDIFHHLINHGTYHRGQIMDTMRELGYETTPTDYIYYVRFRR